MNTTKQQRKIKALELMKKLDIYKPYIDGFKDNDYTCFFEGYGGYWTWQDEELENKQKEVENEYNCTVYAITHEITNIGEMYDFLIVPNDKSDWHNLVEKQKNNEFYVFAYVWNKTTDYCNEFGTIGIRSLGGGIARTM